MERMRAQGLSQDLETGCPILAIEKFLGVQILTINMYTFIKIRHSILILCHGNYMEIK